MSVVGFAAIGDPDQPSPSIWGDCPNTLLNDKGLGVFFSQDFLGDYATPAATTTAPGIETFTGAGTTVIGAAASATYGPNALSVATGGTDNNNVAIYGEEFSQIQINSGKKVWFEARIALAALGDAAFFVGLTTRAGAITATTGVIAADPSNSAAADTVAVTSIGFITQQAASAIAKVDAFYKKAAGTKVTVLADVTNATAIPVASRANVVAQTYLKLGIRFDGSKLIRFYVNGYEVAQQTVDSTFDTTSYLVPVVALKTGAAAAVTGVVDFVRAGYQKR